jgi:hypothetical protein
LLQRIGSAAQLGSGFANFNMVSDFLYSAHRHHGMDKLLCFALRQLSPQRNNTVV